MLQKDDVDFDAFFHPIFMAANSTADRNPFTDLYVQIIVTHQCSDAVLIEEANMVAL